MDYMSFKYRLYPTAEQQQYLRCAFGAKRWVYNYFLFVNLENYKNKIPHLSAFDCNLLITDLKKQDSTSWLADIDDSILKNASADLGMAYNNFFKSVSGKRKGKKLNKPIFKKKSNSQSFRTRDVKITSDGIKIPRLDTPIDFVEHRNIPTGSKIKSATISLTPSGKYFISVLVELTTTLKPLTGKDVGVDLGIKDLIITSDGVKFQHPDVQLSKNTKLLKQQQKILSRKQKGSNNYEKQRIKVAKLYESLTNQKRNYYHLISNYLVSNYDTVVFENLNVSGLMKNKNIARAIGVASWGLLTQLVKYKCDLYGKTYHEIGRYSPSTKTCSCCNFKLDQLKLNIRSWVCPNCNAEHDRDINAANNILNFGLVDLYGGTYPGNRGSGINEIPMALKKFVSS